MKLTEQGEFAITPEDLCLRPIEPIRMECSLQEWVDSLPVGHRARVELHLLQKVQLDSKRKFLEDASTRIYCTDVTPGSWHLGFRSRAANAVAGALNLWKELQKSA